MYSTGIMKDIDVSTYGLKMDDIAVAALIKSYLNQMTADGVTDALERIVNVGVKVLSIPTRRGTIHVKDMGVPQEVWTVIDGAELAALIDSAKAVAILTAADWKANKGERLLKKTLDYVREDFLPELSGEKYVAAMPVEIAEFITDCYLTAKGSADGD